MGLSTRARVSDALDTLLPPAITGRLPDAVNKVLKIGPRHGSSRGFSLYGPAPRDHLARSSAILQAEELTAWLAARGEPCDYTRPALAAVERLLDQALADDELGPILGSEVALFAGQVLVCTVDGAHWAVWPNGLPVVRLLRSDVDVFELANAYVYGDGAPLTSLLDKWSRSS